MIFRPIEGLRSSQSLGLSPLQSNVDGLVSGFVAQATDPQTLGALTTASFAYCAARAATASRIWSIPFAFSSEVGVFEFANRFFTTLQNRSTIANGRSSHLWSFAGDRGILHGLAGSAVTLGILKGAGHLARGENLIFQHLFQTTGMVFGHRVTGAFNPDSKLQENLPEQFLEAEAILLQMRAGMRVVQGLFPGLSGLERKLVNGIRLSSLLPSPSTPFPAPASKRPFPSLKISLPGELRPDFSLSLSRALPTAEIAERLKRRFAPSFPPEGPESYTDNIIEKALQTPSEIPQFHERLLEALVHSPEKGTYSQALSVEAIRLIFSRNALLNPVGSFDNALLQLLVRSAIQDPRSSRRNQAFASLFEAMNGGISRGEIIPLLLRLGYGQGLGLRQRDIDRHLWIQSQLDGALVSGRYDAREIEKVLDHAKGHPFGKLILRRMFQIFAVGDIPAKLKELTSLERPSTLDRVLTLLHRGLPPETVAEEINGTFHTAFIDDMRLARKEVAIYRGLFEARIHPDLKEARRRFEDGLLEFLFSQGPLSAPTMMDLIRINPDERSAFLHEAWKRGYFKIEILNDRAYDDLLRRWGKSASKYSLFDQGDDRILIREMPMMNLTSYAGQLKAFHHVLGRLKGLVHEGEHWRHTSGNYQGVERYSDPIALGNIGRRDRLVSETMAYLEEYLWAYQNFDDDFGGLAWRLGENLPLYFRNLADEAYFRKINEKRLKDWWGELPEGF